MFRKKVHLHVLDLDVPIKRNHFYSDDGFVSSIEEHIKNLDEKFNYRLTVFL